jgi:UDP-N-acetylglucosamine-lysosomal-enzyme
MAEDLKINLCILVLLSLCGCRYECTSRSFRDNLRGVSYEDVLSYGPIDVVYTWVNGSDPIWLNKKKHYER